LGSADGNAGDPTASRHDREIQLLIAFRRTNSLSRSLSVGASLHDFGTVVVVLQRCQRRSAELTVADDAAGRVDEGHSMRKRDSRRIGERIGLGDRSPLGCNQTGFARELLGRKLPKRCLKALTA
jgi:hypothetical protein